MILLAKKGVEGVYDDDPKTNPDATMFTELNYIEILNRGLKVMDSTATSLCMDNSIPIIVFGLENPENIIKIVKGEIIGTMINND